MASDRRALGRLDVILLLALAVISLWRLWPGIADTRFHRDEARWIGNSALLREWRDPFGPKWQDEGYPDQYGSIDESVRRRSQPPLAMYVIGLGLMVQGEGLPRIGYWIMNEDTEWNTDQGNMPTAAQLQAARRVDVFITIATVLLVYLIGRGLTNRIGAFAGASMFAIHPLVLDTGTRAWSDPLLVLTIALATLLAMRLADKPTWLCAVLLGIVLGLGGATKLSPLPFAFGLGLLSALLFVVGFWGSEQCRRLGLRLLAVPVAASVTLVALYPYLWVSPIRNTWRMFEFRSRSFDLQSEGFPPAAVTSRADAFRRVGHELAERLSAAGQISTWLGHSPDSWIRELDLVFATIGLLLLVAIVVRRGITSPAAMALTVLGGQAALILLTIGVEYARYFLPLVLAETVFVGVAIGVAAERVSTWRNRSTNYAEAATVSA